MVLAVVPVVLFFDFCFWVMGWNWFASVFTVFWLGVAVGSVAVNIGYRWAWYCLVPSVCAAIFFLVRTGDLVGTPFFGLAAVLGVTFYLADRLSGSTEGDPNEKADSGVVA